MLLLLKSVEAWFCFQERVYADWLTLLQEEKPDIPGHTTGKQSRDFDKPFRHCRSPLWTKSIQDTSVNKVSQIVSINKLEISDKQSEILFF